MGNGLHFLALILASSSPETEPCTPTAHGDYGWEDHSARDHARDLRALEGLMGRTASFGEFRRELGPSAYEFPKDPNRVEHWWVYGAHRKHVTCTTQSEWETGYFTQYAIFVVTFQDGKAVSCAHDQRAYFSSEPNPDPRSSDSAPPWDRKLMCTSAAD
jgi:hypothetical protein